uniref:MIF4G domain-containing protein n=1 Tax=Polytomella parva TaxID=51329 RepID=A0A7S0VDC9_9CHLO|mmetsp:Transcript_33449/g.60427  ORF Transcript_33449/g.60427 Transcript_33449/m.60427 type:complete len:263 (+) Transcript_33449:39-827(+)
MSEVALRPRNDSGSDDGILQGLVNKLTLDNHYLVVPEIIEISKSVNIIMFSELVIEKAMVESTCCDILAKMCKGCYPTDPEQHKNFRKVLLNCCQVEFEIGATAFLNQAKELSENEKSKDNIYQKYLKCRRYTGLMKFIGMLFRKGMISPNIIRTICIVLLGMDDIRPPPECVEGCSKLISIIGEILSRKPLHCGNENDKTSFLGQIGYHCFGLCILKFVEDRFTALIEKKHEDGQYFYEPRVRFLMQDILDLKARKWLGGI